MPQPFDRLCQFQPLSRITREDDRCKVASSCFKRWFIPPTFRIARVGCSASLAGFCSAVDT